LNAMPSEVSRSWLAGKPKEETLKPEHFYTGFLAPSGLKGHPPLRISPQFITTMTVTVIINSVTIHQM